MEWGPRPVAPLSHSRLAPAPSIRTLGELGLPDAALTPLSEFGVPAFAELFTTESDV